MHILKQKCKIRSDSFRVPFTTLFYITLKILEITGRATSENPKTHYSEGPHSTSLTREAEHSDGKLGSTKQTS